MHLQIRGSVLIKVLWVKLGAEDVMMDVRFSYM